MSEPGNLFASLLLTDPAPAEHWPELAFVAALAIHDAVAEVAPGIAAAARDQVAERPAARRRRSSPAS